MACLVFPAGLNIKVVTTYSSVKQETFQIKHKNISDLDRFCWDF